ncbi:unnamed protein product, partial [Ectocarpus sp. 12 AP-2014]
QARTYALNFSSTSSLSAAERERRQQGSTRCVWLKLACNSSIHGHSQGALAVARKGGQETCGNGSAKRTMHPRCQHTKRPCAERTKGKTRGDGKKKRHEPKAKK